MYRLIRSWVCLLLAFTLIFPLPVLAATDRGDLVITVVRESDETPVFGAKVRVTNREKTRVLAETTTDAEGKARLNGLLIGDVFVEVSEDAAGRDGALVTISSGVDNNFEAYLIPGDETDVVTITDDRLLVNGADPTEGATTRRDREFLDRQLAQNNSLQAVMSTVPGVQTNSLGQVHVRGEHKALSLSLDGIDLPIATESSITQPIDPEFIDTADVSTGMYDASQGGQLGAVVNATTPGEGEEPFAEFTARVGDYGQSELVLKAGGSNEDNTFSYFVGARRSTSDLYLEAPHPDQQNLNNDGELLSFLVRLNGRSERNRYGLTLSHQNADFGVPQTPQNFASGVRQEQQESNSLALLSWNHEITDDDDLLLGLALQRNRQRVNNNGIFTPFAAVPAALEEELAEEGFPLDPSNPGSPYLPLSDLTITQVKPSLDFTHRFSDNHRIKAGLTANFMSAQQELFITDPGGGGGLPNPTSLPGSPTAFAANLNRDAFTGGLYVSHTVPLSDTLTLNYGLRADTFDDGLSVSTSQLSPRFNLSYAPTEEQALRFSYNRLFQPPPIEIDTSGGTEVLPQRTHAWEVSYENQFAKNVVGKIAYVYKDFQDQIDVALLIPNSNIPVFAPINFARAEYQGVELSVSTSNKTGWNGFLAATIGEARPTEPGLFADHFPEYNDHDQRVQTTAGVSYTWESGLSAAADVLYGSGFPQEALPLYNSIGITPYGLTGNRQDRFITNLSIQYMPNDDNKDGATFGAGLQVFNLFDDRSNLNFLSEFSGTRFVTGRRFLMNLSAKF
jgi:outer membrane receptor protein involved in Fe transport